MVSLITYGAEMQKANKKLVLSQFIAVCDTSKYCPDVSEMAAKVNH
jgi:hypothetical protein